MLEEILEINKKLEKMKDDFAENVRKLNNRLESTEKNLTNMKDTIVDRLFLMSNKMWQGTSFPHMRNLAA